MVIHKNVYLYHDIAMILVTKITIFSNTIPLTYHTNLTFKSSRHKYPDILFFFKCAVCVYVYLIKRGNKTFYFYSLYIYLPILLYFLWFHTSHSGQNRFQKRHFLNPNLTFGFIKHQGGNLILCTLRILPRIPKCINVFYLLKENTKFAVFVTSFSPKCFDHTY